MLRLSKQIDYAFHLLGELAKSKTTLSLSQVASSHHLSLKFLERVAAKLKTAKLISAKSGSSGGYILVKSPKEVTLDQIITAIEGDWHVVDCLKLDKPCSDISCSHRPLLKAIESSFRDSLSRYSIADLTKTPRQK